MLAGDPREVMLPLRVHLLRVDEFAIACQQSRLEVRRLGARRRSRSLELLHAAMAQRQLQPDSIRVVPGQRRRVADEAVARPGGIVLHVPAAGALRREVAALSFLEHLAFAVRLAANRVVAKYEPQ